MGNAEAVLFERELALEANEAECLERLLANEQSLLVGHRHDMLLGIAAQKAHHVASLERLAARRGEHLSRAGLSGDADGMLDWLAAHPERESAAESWSRIQRHAHSAREANEINGALVAAELQRFQRRLAFLSAAASNDPTYAPDGYTRAIPPQRTLGEA